MTFRYLPELAVQGTVNCIEGAWKRMTMRRVKDELDNWTLVPWIPRRWNGTRRSLGRGVIWQARKQDS